MNKEWVVMIRYIYINYGKFSIAYCFIYNSSCPESKREVKLKTKKQEVLFYVHKQLTVSRKVKINEYLMQRSLAQVVL